MRDYLDLLRKRILLNDLCEKKADWRATTLAQCKTDPVLFIDNFCFTYDPRKIPSDRPFILYPKQIELIKWLEMLLERSRHGEKINAVADKPRDVGATYTFMAWCLWHFLFDEFSVRVGSRKEDYVDKRGEPDTLFFKLDYMMERMPEWLLQAIGVKDWKKYRSYLMFGHPSNDNAVSGESANPDFGRGGRKSITIFDEFGFWQWARSSWESSGESTNFRFAISTPPETGRDSHFYKLLSNQMGKIEQFSFDWQDVPLRDEKWLEQAKASKSEAEFAREVLKSFEGTVEGKVYAADFRLTTLNECDYNPELPLFVSWDFGLDETAMLWIQKDFKTEQVYLIDSYRKSDKTIDFFVPFVNGQIKSKTHQYTSEELEIIERHKAYQEAQHFGDPDVKKRNMVDKSSVKDVLEKEAIYIQTHYRTETDLLTIRDKTRMLFRRLQVNEKRCEYFIDCIRNARYPERSETSQSTTEGLNPIHDWTSHFRTSLEYFVDNEPSREKRGELLTEERFDDNAKTGIIVKQGLTTEKEMLFEKPRTDWRYT